ncbi:S1C family serine protease [Brevibacillus dissolubilis]|uniref:S1C family serine protease n=1 Tax=Brevibacillus dissolubilis TaxID=1844116 RepID=UPI00210066D6|nr:trypsin-like peptidase domain-containing protein [Brevibacillus dissolubilis]
MKKRWSHFVKQNYMQSSSLHPFNFFVPLVEQVKNGVVSIVTEDTPSSSDIGQLLQEFLRTGQFEQVASERSFGSGFIFHPKGYILTSEHVVGNSQSILVKLCNGKVYEAQTVFKDHLRDYAVIKINADHKLQALPLGQSADAKVGEWVISVGSPLGLENSVTDGCIRSHPKTYWRTSPAFGLDSDWAKKRYKSCISSFVAGWGG